MPSTVTDQYKTRTHRLRVEVYRDTPPTPDDLLMHYSRGAAIERFIGTRNLNMSPSRKLRALMIPRART